MNRLLLYCAWTAVLLCGAAAVRAQSPADETIPVIPVTRLERIAPQNLYHVGLSGSMGFNIKSSFKNLGEFPVTAGNPGPATPGANHVYDDGYNKVDSNGNNHGGFEGTWNWGYNNASQISGNTVAMHSSSWGSGGSSANNSGDPQPGFELTFGRELQRAKHWRWGLEGAFGFTAVTIQDSRPVSASQMLTTDTYSLNGIVPPAPPYHGTPNGPGPIISDTPVRTNSVAGTATISGSREIDAQIFGFKLGPYVEIPLNDRWALEFLAGLALVDVNSQFSYHNLQTTISGSTTAGVSGSGYHNGLLAGGYAGARVSYAFNASTRLFAGSQFQDAGKFTQNVNGRKAVLDLGNSIFVAIGLSYSY